MSTKPIFAAAVKAGTTMLWIGIPESINGCDSES